MGVQDWKTLSETEVWRNCLSIRDWEILLEAQRETESAFGAASREIHVFPAGVTMHRSRRGKAFKLLMDAVATAEAAGTLTADDRKAIQRAKSGRLKHLFSAPQRYNT